MRERVRSRGEAEAEQRDDPERRPLICEACGNGCRRPGFSNRAYACPQCGQRLPDPQSMRRARRRAPRMPRMRADPRAALSGTVLMAAAAMALHAGLSNYRAVAAGTPAAPRPIALVRITERQAQSYAFRQRQLEEDLKRDASDYEVLLRLGQLHLQLAEYRGEGHSSHLRRARHYLLLAGMQAEFRSDAYLVHTLLDAANAPNPGLVLATMPGEIGPPPRDDIEWIRWRLGVLEEQVRYQPRSSRLLRRLADNYTALYQVLDPGGPKTAALALEAGSIAVPQVARRRAEEFYQRAAACALTHEALCRALYRHAELCRVTDEPMRAAQFLRQILRIQPNNWLVSLELASLDRQLGQMAGAQRLEALAARWRTPSWL